MSMTQDPENKSALQPGKLKNETVWKVWHGWASLLAPRILGCIVFLPVLHPAVKCFPLIGKELCGVPWLSSFLLRELCKTAVKSFLLIICVPSYFQKESKDGSFPNFANPGSFFSSRPSVPLHHEVIVLNLWLYNHFHGNRMWSSPLNPDFTLTNIKRQESWRVHSDIFYSFSWSISLQSSSFWF